MQIKSTVQYEEFVLIETENPQIYFCLDTVGNSTEITEETYRKVEANVSGIAQCVSSLNIVLEKLEKDLLL